MASPTGVVLMDFWDTADVENVANATVLEEDEGGVAEEKGAIGGHIQKLADFKETLIFKWFEFRFLNVFYEDPPKS